MKDIIINCVGTRGHKCGKEFVFNVRDQEYFQERGWGAPTRCKACREKRKAEKEAFERREASPFNSKNINREKEVGQIY
jgi:hypothetical protein